MFDKLNQYKKMLELIKTKNKLLRLITPECKNQLLSVEGEILKIINTIETESGFKNLGSNGFVLIDNLQNMNDPEFRSFDTYLIERGVDGYHPTTKVFNQYSKFIREKEEAFCEKYKDLLTKLHILYNEVYSIYSTLELKDESNRELLNQFLNVLGIDISEEKRNKK